MGKAVSLAWGLALSAAIAGGARAQETLPQELEDVSIVDRAGAQVPGDIALLDHAGQQVTLADYLGDGKPLLLVLAYYRCPMLCSLVVNGLTDGMKGLPWDAGERYRVVVVSFDPRDTVTVAREKRANYLREYGHLVSGRGFDFLVGDEANVRRLADAVGFRYKWDEATGQYAHAAGAFALTPQGKVSRTLHGIVFEPANLKLALLEASKGAIGSAWDRVVLFCFHYDPSARGYVLAATRLMTAGGAGTMVLLGVFLLRLWRKENRSGASSKPEAP